MAIIGALCYRYISVRNVHVGSPAIERTRTLTHTQEKPLPSPPIEEFALLPRPRQLHTSPELPRIFDVEKKLVSKKKVPHAEVVKESIEAIILEAEEFYKEHFLVPTISNAHINLSDINAREGIYAESFFDSYKTPYWFIPLFSKSGVVAVSIFQKSSEGEVVLGEMGEITEQWYSYPPVTAYDAKTELISNYPGLEIIERAGFYHEGGHIPYYLFEGNDGNTTKYYLVSAHAKGDIVVRDNRQNPSVEERKLPQKLNSEGLFEIDESFTSGFSAEELKEIKKGIALTNWYIENGIMKFDKNMNLVLDKRDKQHFVMEQGFLRCEPACQDLPSDNTTLDHTHTNNALSERIRKDTQHKNRDVPPPEAIEAPASIIH